MPTTNNATAQPTTTQVLHPYHGRTADYVVGASMIVHVQIIDSKKAYGRVDCLISPLAGAGSIWVQLSSLTLHAQQ